MIAQFRQFSQIIYLYGDLTDLWLSGSIQIGIYETDLVKNRLIIVFFFDSNTQPFIRLIIV
jgi:hypothetical protein